MFLPWPAIVVTNSVGNLFFTANSVTPGKESQQQPKQRKQQLKKLTVEGVAVFVVTGAAVSPKDDALQILCWDMTNSK